MQAYLIISNSKYIADLEDLLNIKLRKSNDIYLFDNFYDEFREIILNFSQDTLIDIDIFIYENDLPIVIKDLVFSFLKEKKNGIYSMSDMCMYFASKGLLDKLNIIKNSLKEKLSTDIIETALVYCEKESIMDASKSLYIHRNTLNYRLELIKKVTSLDLREFRDKVSFYILFK